MSDPLDAITYEVFGIDPASFYATRFSDNGEVFKPQELAAHSRRVLGMQKFDFIVEEMKLHPGHGRSGFKVLDIGCGSGRIGAYVKYILPNIELYGVDMSEACIETSLRAGYDHTLRKDFTAGLPFEDSYFDFVFSSDTIGHVEFRSKDRLIAEIARVTKPGGRGFHGIESGFIDYLNANPLDENDPVRRYVYIDGHIGVETVDQNYERFFKHLEVTRAFNWLVPPVQEVRNAINHNIWGADFSRDVSAIDTPEATALADSVLGIINRRSLQLLFSAFGPILTQSRLKQMLPKDACLFSDYVKSITTWGGFAMVGVHKQS